MNVVRAEDLSLKQAGVCASCRLQVVADVHLLAVSEMQLLVMFVQLNYYFAYL